MKVTIQHTGEVDYPLAVSGNGNPIDHINPGETRIYEGFTQLAVSPPRPMPVKVTPKQKSTRQHNVPLTPKNAA